MSTTTELLQQHKKLLDNRMTELRAEIAALQHQSAAKRSARDALNTKIAEMMATRDRLVDEINAIEQPRLHDLKSELSRVASAVGAIRLNQGETP